MSLESVDFKKTWSVLKETVKVVLTLEKVPRTAWESGFIHVHNLCTAQPDELYQATRKLLEDHVNSLLIQVNEKREEEIIKQYYIFWKQYRRGIDNLDTLYKSLNKKNYRPKITNEELLAYLERVDSELPEENKEIGELGLDLWVTNMIKPLKVDLLRLLLGGIHCDRTGQSLCNEKSSTIQGVIQSFVSVKEKAYRKMGLHEEVFERPFLEETGEYYGQEASRLLQECTISFYMKKVLQRRKEEDLRSLKFLHKSSYSKVRSEFEKRMIADNLAAIHNECPTMLELKQHEDLGNAYELLKSIPGSLTVLVSHFKEHIKQEGLRRVTNLSGDNMSAQFLEAGMLRFHSEYKEITNTVFSNDQLFSSALDVAYAEVVNNRPNY